MSVWPTTETCLSQREDLSKKANVNTIVLNDPYIVDVNQNHSTDQRNRRYILLGKLPGCCTSSPCLRGLLLGVLLSGLVLAVIITCWLTSSENTLTTAAKTNNGPTTTSTTAITTTATTATTTAAATTATTATTTTTATTCRPICANYTWNQTGIALADTSSNPIPSPTCIMLNGNDTVYVCGHTVGYVEKFAITGSSRTAATSNTFEHLDYISFDKSGGLYTTNHAADTVQYYPPSSTVATVLVGSPSSITGLLHPKATAVDKNNTLYINDRNNERKEYSINMLFYSSAITRNGK